MTDDKVGKAKGYGSTVNTEAESIALAKLFLARHNHVVAHLSEGDKTPNIDGRVELKDGSGTPIGSLEVQVKTLGVEHKCKYCCDVGFLYYCEDAQNPVLFFCVDRREEKVYWLLIDSSLLTSLNYKENKGDKTLTLKEEQVFDRDKDDYKDEWLQIVQRHKLKVKNYDKLEEENKRLKFESDNKVSQENKGNKSLLDIVMNEANINFVNIHKFLDRLNGYLDNEFNIIKRVLYKNCWKLGFAYLDYAPHYATYFIYPIAKDRNDVQIKKIDKMEKDALLHRGSTLRGCGNPNAIESRPEAHAKSLLKEDINELFKFGLLNYRNDFLANEFIIAFIDKLRVPLGLEKKDSYSLEEVKYGFYKYLLVWVSEARDFINKHDDKRLVMNRLISESGYIDPSMLEERLFSEEKSIVAEKVKKRLEENNKVSFSSWNLLWNNKYSFVVFADLLNYLSDKRIEKINRVYKEYKVKEKSFKITQHVLEILKGENFPDDILEKLKCLEEQQIVGKEEFLDKVNAVVGDDVKFGEKKSNEVKSLILKHAYENNTLCGYYGFDEFEHNIRRYFENLEDAYNFVVKANFPMLEKQLSLYSEMGEVDRLVVTMRYEKFDDGLFTMLSEEINPHITIYLLSSFLKNDDGNRWSFFESEEGKAFDVLCENIRIVLKRLDKIKFEGKDYKLISFINDMLHVNEIEKMAVFDYVNKTLKEKIEKMLTEKTE